MTTPFEPVIGEWYKTPEGETFEVVALDEHDGTIDVQYYDGTVEEFDMETWGALELLTAAPPEDTAGAYDDVGSDDFRGLEELEAVREDWAQSSFDDYD